MNKRQKELVCERTLPLGHECCPCPAQDGPPACASRGGTLPALPPPSWQDLAFWD